MLGDPYFKYSFINAASISLGDLNTKDKERSFALKNLSKLDRLTHLNLCTYNLT